MACAGESHGVERDEKAELRKRAREPADYRRAVLTNEELVELVENPAAPAIHRVGAAVLLGARGDGEARDRIRIAAEVSANDTLRVALSSVIADDAALEEAAIEELLAERKRR